MNVGESLEVAAMASPFVIMGALSVMLYAAILITRISARRDRGQPWALHYSGHSSRPGQSPLTPAAVVASVQVEPPLDPDAVVREAMQIVTSACRADG